MLFFPDIQSSVVNSLARPTDPAVSKGGCTFRFLSTGSIMFISHEPWAQSTHQAPREILVDFVRVFPQCFMFCLGDFQGNTSSFQP